jgi:23S rRNA (cytosine1962-C5)-methyltransferase
MERLKNEIVAALQKVIKPRAILWRNDAPIRELENLPLYVEPAFGDFPETVQLEEHGTKFDVPLQGGQKTGWFYDQRMNHARARVYAPGKRVLDVFSYLGGFGVQMAHAGAESVTCVDSSQKAADLLVRNANLNEVGAKVNVVVDDAFDALQRLRAERQRFDVVVIDPPAFIKRKKDIKQGAEAYRRLNQMAMQVLAKDGILISCSCSYHLTRDELRDTMLKASRHIDRSMQIVEEGHQAPDHPVHPAIAETAYLKAFFARVLPA